MPTEAELRLQEECRARGGSWVYNPDGGGYGCTNMSNLTDEQWAEIGLAARKLDQGYGPGPAPKYDETHQPPTEGVSGALMVVGGAALLAFALFMLLKD